MRHRVYGKHLGRDKNQRTALFRGLVRSLFLHGSIQTTEVKAKAIKGLVDRLIVKSKEKNPASQRVVRSFLPQAEVSQKLIKEIAPQYKSRNSGFTEVVRLGKRLGDGAMMVKMSLIKEEPVKSKAKAEAKPEKKVAKEEKTQTAKIEEVTA